MENNNVDVLTILNEINDTMKLVLAEIKKGNEQKVKNTPNLFDIFGGMQQNQGIEEDDDDDDDEEEEEEEDEESEQEQEDAEEDAEEDADETEDADDAEEQAEETLK